MVFFIISFLSTFTAVLSVFFNNFLVRFFIDTTSYSDFKNDLPLSGNSKTFKYFHSHILSSVVSMFLTTPAHTLPHFVEDESIATVTMRIMPCI